MGYSVKIQGVPQLIGKLTKLQKEINKVNRKALNRAGTVLLKGVRANVPVDKGDLKESLTKKIYKGSMVIVGADGSYVGADGEKPANYDHLVEYGHISKDGTQVPAEPFIRTAWEECAGQAQKMYEDALKKGIDELAGGTNE